MKLRLKDSFGMTAVGETAASSLKGTNIIAQGKAQSRHPGNISPIDSDPDGVEQTPATDVAPLQGANDPDVSPGFHPGLLSSSPSATGGVYRVIGQPEDIDGAGLYFSEYASLIEFIPRRMTRWRRTTRFRFLAGLKTLSGLGIIAARNAASSRVRSDALFLK